MKHNFKERKENRIQYAKDQALKNKTESESLYKSAKEMADFIPFGQPILVGHHSEKSDRSFRNKIHNTFGKSFEKSDKAEYYENKAEIISGNTAIFSDDPEAITKLKEKLNTLEQMQEFMKSANKCIKKKDKESFLKLEFGTENLWNKLTNPEPHISNIGFPCYKFSNNSANIRNVKMRIQQLEKLANMPAVDLVINGVRIFENREANRLQLIFDGKPHPEIIKKLKQHAFRWCRTETAWQRHISRAAAFSAKLIADAVADLNN